MSLKNKIVLVSGANRGIGAATVRALLEAGVAKVYAGARKTGSLPDFADSRVAPLQLDVTDDASVQAAADVAKDIDVLLNNAGTAAYGDVLTGSTAAIEADMNTNYYGTLRMVRAFAPRMAERKSGLIANVVSVVGLAPVPALGGYSASKAALHSLTLALRGTLSKSGVAVVGIYPGPIDTDLAKDLPLEKVSADHAASNIVRGLEERTAYIFPDPASLQIEQLWAHDGKQLEAALGR